MTYGMLGKIVSELVRLPSEVFGIVYDFVVKLSDPEWVEGAKRFLRKEESWPVLKAMEQPAILRLISGGETLVLDETDGIETIPTSEGVFGYIDRDFKNWCADEASGPTPKTPVAVHELARDATFSQMFGSNPGAFCLTQSQILGFVKKYWNWLRKDGYATFFLFRSKGELFVAAVSFIDRGRLRASVSRFADDFVWRAGRRHRLVLPQL